MDTPPFFNITVPEETRIRGMVRDLDRDEPGMTNKEVVEALAAHGKTVTEAQVAEIRKG